MNNLPSLSTLKTWMPTIYGFNNVAQPNPKPTMISKMQPTIVTKSTQTESLPLINPNVVSTNNERGMVYRKLWQFGTVYNLQDVVEFSQQCYVSLQNNNISNYPEMNSEIWAPLSFIPVSEKGEAGRDGKDGRDCEHQPLATILVNFQETFEKRIPIKIDVPNDTLPKYIQVFIPCRLITNVLHKPTTNKVVSTKRTKAAARNAKFQMISTNNFELILLIDIEHNKTYCGNSNSSRHIILDSTASTVELTDIICGADGSWFLSKYTDEPIYELVWKREGNDDQSLNESTQSVDIEPKLVSLFVGNARVAYC